MATKPKQTRTQLTERYRYDPFCRVAWRWDVAHRTHVLGLAVSKEMDRDTADAVLLLKAEERAAWGLLPVGAVTFERVRAARAIFDDNARQRAEIEARMLARQSSQLIAGKCRLACTVVETYRNLFFDIGDGSASDCILRSAIDVVPGTRRQLNEFDCWRWMGYYGGPVILEMLIGHYDGTPDSDPIQRSQIAYMACLSMYEWAYWGQDARTDQQILRALLRPLSKDPRRIRLPERTAEEKLFATNIRMIRIDLRRRRQMEKASAKAGRTPERLLLSLPTYPRHAAADFLENLNGSTPAGAAAPVASAIDPPAASVAPAAAPSTSRAGGTARRARRRPPSPRFTDAHRHHLFDTLVEKVLSGEIPIRPEPASAPSALHREPAPAAREEVAQRTQRENHAVQRPEALVLHPQDGGYASRDRRDEGGDAGRSEGVGLAGGGSARDRQAAA